MSPLSPELTHSVKWDYEGIGFSRIHYANSLQTVGISKQIEKDVARREKRQLNNLICMTKKILFLCQSSPLTREVLLDVFNLFL